MTNREREALDRFITGNYGEDQHKDAWGVCSHCGRNVTENEYTSGESTCCHSDVVGEEDYNLKQEPDEPQEEDLVTNDYVNFWRHGMGDNRPAVMVPIDAEGFESGKTWRQCVREYMEWQEDSGNQYWPNVWFISDHGNSVLLSLED